MELDQQITLVNSVDARVKIITVNAGSAKEWNSRVLNPDGNLIKGNQIAIGVWENEWGDEFKDFAVVFFKIKKVNNVYDWEWHFEMPIWGNEDYTLNYLIDYYDLNFLIEK